MKIVRSKNLMGLLYGVLLSIPLLSIVSRVIYVQSNKNAYQSYSGQNIYNYEQVETIDQMEGDNEGYRIHLDIPYSTTSYTTQTMNISNPVYISGNLSLENQEKVNNCTSMTIYTGTNNVYIVRVDYTLTRDVSYFALNEFTIILDAENVSMTNTAFIQWQPFIEIKSKNFDSSLDNVFDYSVSKLVDENNFGQLNFFQFFGNLLLTDAQQNMLYVRFANWYMNYALLVSLMQILFLCLMWFVNFSRRLLERGMNYDW